MFIQMNRMRKPTPETRAQLRRALFLIWAVTAAILVALLFLHAPRWAMGAVIVAFPITWLVVGVAISWRKSS